MSVETNATASRGVKTETRANAARAGNADGTRPFAALTRLATTAGCGRSYARARPKGRAEGSPVLKTYAVISAGAELPRAETATTSSPSIAVLRAREKAAAEKGREARTHAAKTKDFVFRVAT